MKCLTCGVRSCACSPEEEARVWANWTILDSAGGLFKVQFKDGVYWLCAGCLLTS